LKFEYRTIKKGDITVELLDVREVPDTGQHHKTLAVEFDPVTQLGDSHNIEWVYYDRTAEQVRMDSGDEPNAMAKNPQNRKAKRK
jgi:hypothetical protein